MPRKTLETVLVNRSDSGEEASALPPDPLVHIHAFSMHPLRGARGTHLKPPHFKNRVYAPDGCIL